MSNVCSVCSKKINFLTQIKIKDGFVCGDCQNRSFGMSNCNCRLAQDYKDRYAYLEENQKLLSLFSPTISIGNYLKVDENAKLFKLGNSTEVFSFSSLVNFELNEDGDTVTSGGLGRAVVAGALFGGVGAVVGGTTGSKKSKTIVKNMYIRIVLNDAWVKTSTITIVNSEVKKGSLLYAPFQALADQLVSAFELITASAESARPVTDVTPISSADEILKYKHLLDAGAITDAEYLAKKKQLLDI